MVNFKATFHLDTFGHHRARDVFDFFNAHWANASLLDLANERFFNCQETHENVYFFAIF